MKLGWQDLNLQNVTSLRLSYGSSVKRMLVVEMSNYNGNSNVLCHNKIVPLSNSSTSSWPSYKVAAGLCKSNSWEIQQMILRLREAKVCGFEEADDTDCGRKHISSAANSISFAHLFYKYLLQTSFVQFFWKSFFFEKKSWTEMTKTLLLLDLNWEEIEVALGKASNSATYHLQIARHAAG